MIGIKVEVTRFVTDDFPGFVECTFIDAHSKQHLIIEKVPVLSFKNLDANSVYPNEGLVACELIEGSNRKPENTISVSTERPWGIESTEGLTVFDVFEDQLGQFPLEIYKT